MPLSASDIEEYIVRKTIDAGYQNPTISDVARVRFLIDCDESTISSYLNARRNGESQEDYDELLDKIDNVRNSEL